MPLTQMNSNLQESRELIEELFAEDGKIQVVSDEDLECYDKGYLVGHNKQYSDLLEIYVKNAKGTLTEKLLYKKIFFWGCIGVLGLMFLVFILALIIAAYKENTIHIVSELVAATVALASALIVLPKIIAEYLFNTSDEKNMVEIIKNMQEYDKSVRDKIRR